MGSGYVFVKASYGKQLMFQIDKINPYQNCRLILNKNFKCINEAYLMREKY